MQTTQKILTILKLASNFLELKNMRPYTTHVQIKQNDNPEETYFYATNGHMAIKIYTFCPHASIAGETLPSQVSGESIKRACKVNALELLEVGDYEVKFPDFEKCFKYEIPEKAVKAKFDINLMATICKALNDFSNAIRKSCKSGMRELSINPLRENNANLMQMNFMLLDEFEIKIDILLMPLKPYGT